MTAMIEVDSEPRAIASSTDRIWVVSRAEKTLTSIDPETNEIDQTIDLDGKPIGLVVRDQGIWIAFEDSKQLVVYDKETLEPSSTAELPAEPCLLWFDSEKDELVAKMCDPQEIHIVDHELISR